MFSTRTLFREGEKGDAAHALKETLGNHALRFEKTPQPFEAWIAVAHLTDVTLCHLGSTAPVHVSRSASEEMTDLYFASEPGATVNAGKNKTVLTHGAPLAVSTDAFIDISLAGGASLLVLQLPHRRLIAQLEMLTGQKVSRKVIFNEAPSPEAPLSTALASAVEFLCGHLEQNPKDAAPSMLHANFLEAIANFLLVGWSNNFTEMIFRGYSPAAPKYVYRAEEYMSRNAHRQITMEELVFLTGVSSRSLQDGFRRFRNTTPMKWLRDRRLDEARHQLLYEDDSLSIQEVALKWGFTNHPHFSRAYRERFGESPQRTRSSRTKRKD